MPISYDDYKKKYKKQITERREADRKARTVSVSNTKATTPTTKKKETWFEAGAFKDGYDFGDITKTILGTTSDVVTGTAKGVAKLGEGIGDLVSYGGAGILDLFGADKKADQIRKKASESLIDKWAKPVDDFNDNYSVLGSKGQQVTEGLGQMAGIMATGGLGASVGLGTKGATILTSAVTGTSSMGQGMGEAYKGGATDGEAFTYGLISGVAEAGTELIFGGLGKKINAIGLNKGLTSADDMLAKKLSEKISNQLAKNLTEYGVKAGAEGFEEVLSGVVQAIGKKVTYMSEGDLLQIVKDENLLDQFIIGAVTSGVAQAPGLISSTRAGTDFIVPDTPTDNTLIDNKANDIAPIQEQTNQPITQEVESNLATEVESNTQEVENVPKELKTYYHGTRGDFEAFDNSKIGQNYDNDWSSLGKGFYFTDNYESAKEYGASSINDGKVNVKEATLDIKKPFYVDEIAQNDSKTLEEIKTKYNLSDDSLSNGYNLIDDLKKNGYDSTEVLKEYGYDGIIASDEVMVFDANQINLKSKMASTEVEGNAPKTGNNIDSQLNKEYNVNGDINERFQRQGIEGNSNQNVENEQGREGTLLRDNGILPTSNDNSTWGVSETNTFDSKLGTTETRKKYLEYAKNNLVEVDNAEINRLKAVAKELGLNLKTYKGSPDATMLGTIEGNDFYLDVNDYGEGHSVTNVFYHEFLHNAKNNKSLYNSSEIKEIIKDFSDSQESNVSIEKFLQNKGLEPFFNETDRKKIVEEILADYTAKHLSNYDVDYSVPQEIEYRLNRVVDDSINELKIKNKNSIDNDIAPFRQELAESTKELVKTVKDTSKEIKVLKQELNEAKKDIKELVEENRALTEADLPMVEQEALENMKSATDDMAPVIEDTTPEYEFENDNEGSQAKPLDPMADRTLEDVGNRKVKAYQYENPEFKPYFQEMARYMLTDLNYSQKGQRTIIGDISQTGGGNYEFSGQKRHTTPDIASLLDSQYNYSYADIEKGLKAIIEDHGAENTAIAKRIEFALNDRLLNGYTDIDGYPIPPNKDYIRMLQEKEYNDYYSSIPTEDIAPVENTLPDKTAFTKRVIESGKQIEQELGYKPKNPTLESTYDDFKPNYEPLLEYMDNLAKRKEARKNKNNVELEDTTPLREATKWEQAKLTLKSLFTNNKAVYDSIAKETGNNEIKYKADRLNTISGETADITTAQLDNNLNPVGKSLNAIFENAENQGLGEAGQDYLFHLSNINRHKRQKGSATYSLNDSQKFVNDFKAKYPELATQLQEDIHTWNKNRRNNLVDSGIIKSDTAKLFEELDVDYVPFFAETDYKPVYTDVGEIKPINTIKRAKGGSTDVLPIKQSMISQNMAEKKAIAQNDLYKEIAKSYGKPAELGADVRLKATDFSDSLYADTNGDKYLTAYVDGERKSVKISDYMYDNIKQTESLESMIRNVESQVSFVFKPLQAFSRFVRNIHTNWSPSFVITNPLKDIQDAPFNSKDAVKFAKNYKSSYSDVNHAKNINKYATEFKKITGQDITTVKSDSNLNGKAKDLYNNYQDGMLWNKFVAGYGSVKMYGDTYSNMDQVIAKETQTKNKGNFKKMLEVVPNVNEFMELSTRYAEFKSSIQNGASTTEAFYNAKDITTNFGRGGVITKALNRNGATFLNASVQGFSKFVRNFSGENGAKGVVGSIAKAVTLGVLPAVFNHLAFGGDEEDEDYKALPDYIKDNYYLIKTDDGEFIRIPKGRALSVFGSAARRTLELAEGEEDAFDGYLKNALSQAGPNNFLESNAFAPIKQAIDNETWYGGDLVPTRLQDKPVAEQYDESTDEFSKWLGQALNISPYKINYVIDQYSGGIGDFILPYITEEANSDGSFLAPLKDKFTANSTMDNKYAGEFYSKMEELEVTANGENATEEDQLRSQYMSAVSWEMSALYKEKREVQNDSSLTKAEKYERVKAIQKEINAISKNALESYDKGTIGENYASIGDYQFNKYVNKNGEEAWGTLYEDEAEDLKALGLTHEEYDTYFAMKQEFTDLNKEYQAQKDSIEETYEKDSEEYETASDELYWKKKNTIIDSIMNSDFTNEQKAYIYNKYYDSDKTDVILTAGIDINYLLDYDKNDFKADYTANGKVISNSRKNKVISYVNDYDLSIAEKAIIIKSANTFKFNAYNNEIVDYVDKLEIPYDEKVYILKSLDMEVLEDGTIRWK